MCFFHKCEDVWLFVKGGVSRSFAYDINYYGLALVISLDVQATKLSL